METGVNSFSRFKEAFRLKEADASQYSPLVLAYIGDAVYEIMIRTKVVNDGNVQVNKLHKHTAGLVKASAQMELLLAVWEELTEEEKTVCRRGRNAKSGSMAKNATMKSGWTRCLTRATTRGSSLMEQPMSMQRWRIC